MSTRACYVFKDADDSYTVFKHHDGYPSGAAQFIEYAKSVAWPLPRFEPDEFAAAFVAANKTEPGGVRLSCGIENHGDIEYVYEIQMHPFKNVLWVKAYEQAYKDSFGCSGYHRDFYGWCDRILYSDGPLSYSDCYWHFHGHHL